VVEGVVLAARELGAAIALVGPTDRLREALRRYPDAERLPISLIEAPEAILMDEAPLAALRRKPRASVKVACELVARGEAQAVVSAGHTGATLVAAHAVFGLVPGVERPALAVTFPTRTGVAVLLDAGANLECRPEHLRQFGVMGAAYARSALGVAQPRVGVLSIGEEAGKGTDLVREAHEALSQAPVLFVGNVDARTIFAGVAQPRVGVLSIGEEAGKGTDLVREAHEALSQAPVLFVGNVDARAIFTGVADVIVCDGFTGNIVLKVGEGLVEAAEAMLRDELGASVSGRFGAWLARPAFRRFKRRVDYAERGAAPLLGVAGLTLVGHGRSSARAIQNAVGTALRLADERMVDKLRTALAT
jgi:glycerol-3-phosphate acyltransferase PlsX